eukprot:4232567-Lingulodinium_polyedra.AAC.1
MLTRSITARAACRMPDTACRCRVTPHDTRHLLVGCGGPRVLPTGAPVRPSQHCASCRALAAGAPAGQLFSATSSAEPCKLRCRHLLAPVQEGCGPHTPHGNLRRPAHEMPA